MTQNTIEWGGSWSINGKPATPEEVESLLMEYFRLDNEEDDVLPE